MSGLIYPAIHLCNSIISFTFASMFEEWKEKYHRFREWQKKPYQVKPQSHEEHDCTTCGTHYEGNYCPRCGQSSIIGRYSFKKAFLLFLDVWGLGNRGMFRSIRDLILRPGYMIRDYLQGMQMAYFPPFKMFFLLLALSLLVDTGLNIKLENRIEIAQERYIDGLNNTLSKAAKPSDSKDKEVEKFNQDTIDLSNSAYEWTTKHMGIATMVMLLLFSAPMYLFFRKSPAYPGLKYSEFFVAMVYITNMVSIYSIVSNFLCLHQLIDLCLYILTIIPLMQLTGYGFWRTTFKIVTAFVLSIVAFMTAVFMIAFIVDVAREVLAS